MLSEKNQNIWFGNNIKIYDIGDVINQKDRIHFLDSCSRFGNVFVGRQNGFDVYAQAELEKSEEAQDSFQIRARMPIG